MAKNLLEITESNFETEVLKAHIPVLVDFWAEWCMPCKMIAPIINELSVDYKNKVKFVKVNVDNNTQLATTMHILSIPLLVLFKDGKEVTRIVGANPKQAIAKEIDTALKGT